LVPREKESANCVPGGDARCGFTRRGVAPRNRAQILEKIAELA